MTGSPYVACAIRCGPVLYKVCVSRVFLDIGGSARATLSLLVQKSLCARERCVLRKIVHTHTT